jgi:hypothetical protein
VAAKRERDVAGLQEYMVEAISWGCECGAQQECCEYDKRVSHSSA